MTVPFQFPDVKISDNEITRWLRAHRLRRTQATITRATNALRAEKQLDSLPLGRDVTIQAADAPGQIIYGYARVGGTISFVDFRANNQYIDLIITLACHEIDGIEKIYVDGSEVFFQVGSDGWSNAFQKQDGTFVDAWNKLFMRCATGAPDQPPINDLVALNSKWTPNHRQRNWAHVYVMLVWDALLYGDGVPDIQFLVRGKKVYDPRTSTTYFSNLSALVAADMLMDTRVGLGVDSAKIDMSGGEGSLQEAANTCGESVDTATGSTEVRYAVNGYWQADETAGRVLERIAASMGGHLTYTNGLWKFWPAKWRAPTLTLTEDDVRGQISMQTLVSLDDAFNAVRGKYVAAAKGYLETDYPAVKNSSYAIEDGRTIWQNIDFQLVTSSSSCQRLAKIELERIRQGIQLEFLASLKAFQLQPPENVSLTFSRYGWTSKPFEVVKLDLVVNEGSGVGHAAEILVKLSLRETASGVFDWNSGEETYGDIAPNTNLPSFSTIEVPSGIMLDSGTAQLFIQGDGTVQPRIKVSWNTLSDFFVTSGGRVEIQYRKAGEEYSNLIDVPGDASYAFIPSVQDGATYDVRVRTVNAFKFGSAWVEVVGHVVVGKTAPPSDVTGFAAAVTDFGIGLAWSAVGDLDLASYEVREGITWSTASFVDRVRALRLDVKTRLGGSHTFLVKAIDTSGNYSTNAASATATIVSPSISEANFAIEGGDVVFAWNAVQGAFALQDFVIRQGDTFGTASLVSTTRGTSFRRTVDWGGTETFWISARDVAGNEGTAFRIDVEILIPDKVRNLSTDRIRNDILFKWQEPNATGTLPVDHYLVLKGPEYLTATVIGDVSGTFFAFFEMAAGDNTYWITAVDTAGNRGLETPIGVRVSAPQDFVLHANVELDPDNAETLDNIAVEGEFLRPPPEGGFVDIGGLGP